MYFYEPVWLLHRDVSDIRCPPFLQFVRVRYHFVTALYILHWGSLQVFSVIYRLAIYFIRFYWCFSIVLKFYSVSYQHSISLCFHYVITFHIICSVCNASKCISIKSILLLSLSLYLFNIGNDQVRLMLKLFFLKVHDILWFAHTDHLKAKWCLKNKKKDEIQNYEIASEIF